MTIRRINQNHKKKIVHRIDTKAHKILVLLSTDIKKKKLIVLYKFQVKIFLSVEQKVGWKL